MYANFEEELHEDVIIYNIGIIKKILHNSPFNRTQCCSMCQCGMTHPTYPDITSQCDIVDNDYKMRIDTIPIINIRGC